MDEQLARHLEQEELVAAASWRPQQVPAHSTVQGNSPPAARNQNSQGDEINFQEQFNKIAESKVFNSATLGVY